MLLTDQASPSACERVSWELPAEFYLFPRRARRWAANDPQASTYSLDGRAPLGRGNTADLDLLGGWL